MSNAGMRPVEIARIMGKPQPYVRKELSLGGERRWSENIEH